MAAIRSPGADMRRHGRWHAVLVVCVIVSAFAVVYVKDMQRRYFIAYQQRDTIYEQQLMRWGQLLLEQSTLARQDRIAQLAQQRLQMTLPRLPAVHLMAVVKEPR